METVFIMERYDVFEFVAPNGANVKAVVLDVMSNYREDLGYCTYDYVCYGQNRLFTMNNTEANPEYRFGYVICDYVIIPEIDEKLTH